MAAAWQVTNARMALLILSNITQSGHKRQKLLKVQGIVFVRVELLDHVVKILRSDMDPQGCNKTVEFLVIDAAIAVGVILRECLPESFLLVFSKRVGLIVEKFLE
ncbi:hypothetical protein BGX34_001641 [Mortierella sp. NVP85]|nr:hypothetical protein BGX34_001641 [Mortierella sp. NVP85]